MTDLEELMQDGLSEYDVQNLNAIIRDGHGSWYHAELMRALHILMPHADDENLARLRSAYPGSTLAYELWYRGELPLKKEAFQA